MRVALLSLANFTPLESLFNIILQQFQSYCLTFISEQKLNFQTSISFTYIETNATYFNRLTDQILEMSEKGCSDYVVRIREPEIFMKAFEKVNHLGNARRSDKKIIILPFNEDIDTVKILLDILSLRETSFVANMLLVLPAVETTPGCSSYDLVTHNFVGPDEDTYKPNYLDKWDSCTKIFKNNVNLFPHDMTNMYGKSLKVGCFTYKPYVLLDLDRSVAPNGRDGTEIRIVDQFCRWINCTIKIVKADEDQWGELFDNMTGIGVLGHVVEDRADLGISALYSWYEMYLFLDFSAPSIRSLITCIAPAPRLLVSWEMPLMPFSWNMWIGMIITFIMSSFALIVAQKGSSDKAFLITFGMLTAQEITGRSWRIRSITGWLLVTGLVLSNAYGAGLASTFTVPKFEKPIDTIQDMIDTKTEWGATHDAWIYSLTLSQEPLIKQLVKQFKIYSAQDLYLKSFTRSMAFSIEKLPAGSFAIGEYITSEALLGLQLMLDNFYYEQNVVMLRKSSPYTNKVSDLIGRLHESGLLLAFETQVALKHLNYKVQIEVKLSRTKKEVVIEPLNFRHVLGIFYIYAIGIILSIVLFILELNKHPEKKFNN